MSTRVLVFGAHPDDAEVFAGGLLSKHASLGSCIRIISVTDGRNGHQSISDGELIQRRRLEAAKAGAVIGAEYFTWDFPDGSLQPTLEVRNRLICEVRSFKPDLVLTHRTCDYHPDHRAVGQAVQDASYLVTVPKIAPTFPPLVRDPVVALMADTFTRPTPLRPDVVFDASPQIEKVLDMLACHASQVFDWLPFNQGILDQVPTTTEEQRVWLRSWLNAFAAQRKSLFWNEAWGIAPEIIEAFEISEYAGRLDDASFEMLFPTARRGN